MSTPLFWDDLFEYVEEGCIIPILGPHLLSIRDSGGEKPLSRFVAERLAEHLRILADNLPEDDGLNHVVCRYLERGGKREDIYPCLRGVMRGLELPTPEPLKKLARIKHFKFYLTTTFDLLLEQALNEERSGGVLEAETLAYELNNPQDLPCEMARLKRPTVYHLLGRLSASPNYAITEEDTLEFFYNMQAYDAVIKPGAPLLQESVAAQIVRFVAAARVNGEPDASSSAAEPLAGLQVEPALLSVVCQELNNKRQKLRLPRITPDLLAGNRHEIIAEFYERSVADLPPAAPVFVEDRLLTKSGYRNNVALEDAIAESGVTADMIERLVKRRLLRVEDRFGVRQVEANPETRLVVECLQADHKALEPQVSAALLHWVARTPKLAGLDISSFDIAELGALSAIHSLRGLDCRNNRLTDLAPLRSMHQLRALYCGQNDIGELEPIKALNLLELDCKGNRIRSLEPLRAMPLNTLYCERNRIEDLSPLKRKSLYALDCSDNLISLLDPISDLPGLGELYCAHNQISSIEPLRQSKGLNYGKFVLARRHGDSHVTLLAQPGVDGRRYLFVPQRMAREEAMQFCNSLQGHLVTIRSQQENDFLKQITPPDVRCRIGLEVSDGEPHWVTDEPVEKSFVSAQTDFRSTDKIVTWKNGVWLPLPWQEEKAMPFIVEWD